MICVRHSGEVRRGIRGRLEEVRMSDSLYDVPQTSFGAHALLSIGVYRVYDECALGGFEWCCTVSLPQRLKWALVAARR